MRERGIPLTVNACAQALSRNLQIADAIKDSGFDLCCHGDRFVRHFLMTEEEERGAIARSVADLERAIGRPPLGWQSRYSPSQTTLALLVDHAAFLSHSVTYPAHCPHTAKS